MSYQGVDWQEIFLERHYTNAAPRRSLLNQGKQLWQGLKNYILNSARTHGFKACAVTAPCIPTNESAMADLEAITGYGFGALTGADPPKKTEAEREAIKAGYPRYCADRGYRGPDAVTQSNIDTVRAAAKKIQPAIPASELPDTRSELLPLARPPQTIEN